MSLKKATAEGGVNPLEQVVGVFAKQVGREATLSSWNSSLGHACSHLYSVS
jgi:hypothetical protein